MSKLTDDVDVKIERQMNDIDLRTQAVGEKVDSLSPLLEKLRHDLGDVDNILSHHILQLLKVCTATGISKQMELIIQY